MGKIVFPDSYYRTRTAFDGVFPETCLSKDNLFYNINLNRRNKMIIYKATNKVNNKSYIGQTIKPLTQRISEHLHA
mgnify:FL=1|jgi:hypothetical protein